MPDKLKSLRHGGMGVVVSGIIRKLSVCSPASKMAWCQHMSFEQVYVVSALCLEIAQCLVQQSRGSYGILTALLHFCRSLQEEFFQWQNSRYKVSVDSGEVSGDWWGYGVSEGLNSPFLLPCPSVLAVCCGSCHLAGCTVSFTIFHFYLALAMKKRFKNVVW